MTFRAVAFLALWSMLTGPMVARPAVVAEKSAGGLAAAGAGRI
jgi:hypothetical protein